ncbi:MAG TPA: FHA domain-containing protein, partial [Gemmatimonadales bacterium]|nr:FHA domain-containing protein [Gemmatimonadales bacterium]
MQLEVGGRRYAIPAGELVVGSDPDCAVRLEGPGIRPRHAVFAAGVAGTTVVRRGADDAEVLINGVRLGAEPAPVLHGDKIQVGEHELLVADERRSGSTQFMSAASLAALEAAPPGPRGSTGGGALAGRLVSLTDGREYRVEDGLSIGRDAACDVVVDGKDVSRNHAEIRLGAAGYVVTDRSTNGTYVNGERVAGERPLARGDVIRVGAAEFRFHAEAMPAGAEYRLNATTAQPAVAQPAVAQPAGSRVVTLASLLARSGPLKGQRFPVRVPVANVGRADYNDVVIPDPSVSGAHAKLQRREGVWILTDLGSTNGTFVNGERLEEETPLGPGDTIALGEVAFLFEPIDGEAADVGGTRVMAASTPA